MKLKYYLGIDLGGTNIAVGLVDGDGKILSKKSVPTASHRTFEDIVKDMAQTAKETLQQAGLDETAIEFVGIGVPSTIDPKTKKVVFANNLGWVDVDVAAKFREFWDIPVRIGNDADCATLGEATCGQAKDVATVLMITIGTGIGGGVIINRKLFRGGDNTGFEPGHVSLVKDGITCNCGLKGCFEVYGSVTALIRQTIDKMFSYPESLLWQECQRDLNKVGGRTAFNAAKNGDKAGNLVVEGFVDYLATGISSLITLFRPEIVIIGGGISKEGDYLLDPLRKRVGERTYSDRIMQAVPIIQANLGNDAGIIGAAMLED